MNDELEDRLRRTYRAVGDHTNTGHVEPGGDFVRTAVGPLPSRRWAGLGLVAAVVLLMVGGLAVLTGVRGESPAASAATHVLPTWLPTTRAPQTGFWGMQLPLVSITSAADTDVIEYAAEALSVTIRVDRVSIDEFEGEPVEVRGGETATVDGGDDAGRLRWTAPEGPTVTIEWVGTVTGGVDSIAAAVDGLILVDESAWDSAIEFSGFTDDQAMLRRQVGPVDVYIEGDLQTGLSFRAGANGFDENTIDAGGCATFRMYLDEDEETHTVVSRFPSGTATITFADGTAATVELSRFVEGSSLGVGVIELGVTDPSVLPDVVCEEAP